MRKFLLKTDLGRRRYHGVHCFSCQKPRKQAETHFSVLLVIVLVSKQSSDQAVKQGGAD